MRAGKRLLEVFLGDEQNALGGAGDEPMLAVSV
jgi:hypothetical protein